MSIDDRIRLPSLNLIQRRPRLLNMLAGFIETEQKRLITIYAPGGYGKSILLADFTQTTNLPICWCAVEPADRDPTSFLTLLAHSIIDRFRDIEADSLRRLVAQGDTPASIRRITDLLAEVGPHVIIVDDYHKAISAGMTLALNKLLEQLPANSHMIIAARGDVNLETGQIIELLMSDLATGLSEEELRFTGPEIQQVMRKRFGRWIDLDSAEKIARATGGNIAQILLTGHMTHIDPMVSRLGQGLGDDQAVIYDYLANDVFAKQPSNLQHFMLHTVVLPEMTIELCNELLAIDSAQNCIETLLHRDLFITQVGAGFRYHDLFAEFLRTRLAEDQARYRQAAARAADLLAGRERFEEAINLYLSVQAWDEAARLLEARGAFFYNTGRSLTLHDWLSQISEQELGRHPRLLLLQGRILNDDIGDPNLALIFYQRAEEQFLKQENLIGVAEAQVLRSARLRIMGHAKEALILAINGLSQLETLKADDHLIAWAIRNRGMAHRASGNIPEALTDLRHALTRYEALNEIYRVGLCHHDIGICLDQQGNLSGAGYHFRQAIRIWEALGNANDLARTLNSLGVSLQSVGRYNEALPYFHDSLEMALQIGAVGRAAYAQAGLGDVYLGQKKYKQARQAYTQSTELARQAGMQVLELYNMVKTGECFYRQRRLDQALDLAGRARAIAAEAGLNYEQGLASALQARIYTRQADYGASFERFAEAAACLAQNDILEQARVRLWWGYSLLLDLRSAAALEQLQRLLDLAQGMGELVQGLGPALAETQTLLRHFLPRIEISADFRSRLHWLTGYSSPPLDMARPGLQVIALGTPAVVVAGTYKLFKQEGHSRKSAELLLYLIMEGQAGGCHWGEVSAVLWPDLDLNKASIRFHQTLKRLRDVVFESSDYIIRQNHYYWVQADYLDWCDVLAFEALFERASTAPPEEALALQLELIALYQGEFLAGVEVEEWAILYRTSREARFLQTVNLASAQLLRNNEPQAALAILRKGLEQDFFREDLHRHILSAYAQLGLYDDLAAHYAQLCETFEQELGASPAATTRQHYKWLMKARPQA